MAVEHALRPNDLMDEYFALYKTDMVEFVRRFQDSSKRLHRRCPACGGKDHLLEFEKNSFDFVSCCDCKCLFVNPVPVPELLADYYMHAKSLDFFHRQVLPLKSDTRRKIFRTRVDLLGGFVSNTDRVLEIGCSSGRFIEAALEKGWDISGVEINEDLVQQVRAEFGVKVTQGLFEEAEFDESFDLVVMWEVMEHLVDPEGVVQKISSILNTGGRFACSLPNAAGIEFQVFNQVLGSEHELLEPPGHLNYFTPGTINRLLRRTGFEIVTLSTPGILDIHNIVSAINREETPGIGSVFLKTMLEQLGGEDREQLYDVITQLLQRNQLSGNMFVVARKV